MAACTSDPKVAQDDNASDEERECTPKDEQDCRCGKASGVSVCSKAGSWGECKCDDTSTDKVDAGKTRDAGSSAPRDAGRKDATVTPNEQALTALPCDVSNIVGKHCGECHGKEPAYGAPMPLVSWEDMQAAAPKTKNKKSYETVLDRVQSKSSPMPPAPRAPLSSAEIAALEAWVNGGMPKGKESCEAGPTTPPETDGLVPKPEDCEDDFELRAHGGSSATDTSKFKTSATPALEGNQYHCFYFDPPYASDAAMYWFQPIIDNKTTIHHWILYATDNKTHASGTSAACNAAEPGAYFVAGWAPGANNATIPNDVALQMPTGSNAGLILELHYYNNTGKTQEDASGIRFCTGKKNARPHLAAVHTLGSEGICVQPGAQSDVSGVCTPRTDMGEIHITGMWPHMHKLARHMKVSVKRKAGATEVIHDEPFDFNTQLFYPKDDIVLKAGDSVETRCTFKNDTTSAVHYGERTQDEMCYAFVMAWPAGALVPPGAGRGATDLLNHCNDNALSILQSCNGLLDAPMTVEHP